jgi:hypothetical protein
VAKNGGSAVTTYTVGLDLGQSQDHTAMILLEQAGHKRHVSDILRWPLGTMYPQIVTDVLDFLTIDPLPGSPLVVDRTGVGRGVFDMFRLAYWNTVGISITNGEHAIKDPDTKKVWRVPKRDLVGVVNVGLQSDLLKFATALPLTKTLQDELKNFKVKITAAANDTYGAWREGQHDDLVLALAVALWYDKHGRPRTVELDPKVMAGVGWSGWNST